MEPSKIKINLGGQEFEITTPLRFCVLKRFEPAFVRYGGALVTTENFQGLAEGIVHVINDEHPDFKMDDMDKLRTTPEELIAAADQLGYASGIYKKKDPAAAKEGAVAEDPKGEGQA